uniref:Uncharacterized protein n=1 Tax=Romanomermis culicivorax TaxID=13658 RepID=A0A915IT84_ROMCU
MESWGRMIVSSPPKSEGSHESNSSCQLLLFCHGDTGWFSHGILQSLEPWALPLCDKS